MIVYKNKRFMQIGLYPDTDWVGDADYVVPDDSEIAEKIKALYPNFEIVEDGDGNISDVVKKDPEPTETVPEITTEQRLEAAENAIEEIITMLMGG